MTRARAHSILAAVPLALLLALSAALAGCGSDDRSGDGVASASGESSKPLSEDELHEKLLAYAQCLRDNGLDVEDPAPGEGIQIQVEGDRAQADAAMKACEDLAPPPPSDTEEADARENMLKYAKCMRDNGVEKFADPKPGEGINIGPEVAEDPDFKKAEETCDEVFGGDTNRNSNRRSA